MSPVLQAAIFHSRLTGSVNVKSVVHCLVGLTDDEYLTRCIGPDSSHIVLGNNTVCETDLIMVTDNREQL